MALFWLSGAFALGVVLGSPLDWRVALVLCVGAFLVAVARRATPVGRAALVLAALSLGAARAPHPPGPPSPPDLRFYNGHTVTVLGQVTEEPDIRDTGANYVVAARQVMWAGRTLSVGGRLQVHTSRAVQLEYGDELRLTGRLQTPANSPTLAYRDILAGRGIFSQMEFPRTVDLGAVNTGPLGWIVPFRQLLERGIDRSLPEPEAALLIAITLGAHSASLGTLAPALVATGLIHLIAISGIKVALVAGTVWTLLVALRRRTLSLVLSLAMLCFYVLLTGATASGERSALMWSLVFVATFLGRNTVALVSLGFVAALMVAIDPALPWDIGFQLSTVGTFAIVALSGPLLRLLRPVPSPFREALGVTLAAQVGTVPIVAGGFHALSLVGPVANALVLPLLPLTIALGFLLGVLAGVPPLAAPLGLLAYAVTHAIVRVAEGLSGSRAALLVPSPNGAVSATYYLVLGGFAWLLLRRAGWAPAGQWGSRTRELALALLLVASLATVSIVEGASPARLTYLGTGAGFVLQSDGSTAVIDGSARPLLYLSALGETLGYRPRTIDLVVVTDDRSSNIAAVAELPAHYQVGAVLDVGTQYPEGTYAAWRTALRTRHIPVYALRAGTVARVGHALIQGLAPDAVCPLPVKCAGVLRIVAGRHSFLLATRAGGREQEDLVFAGRTLRAGTLLLGDGSTAAGDFVRAVRARSVLCLTPGGSCTALRAGQTTSWPL